jgi:hypothetical protein
MHADGDEDGEDDLESPGKGKKGKRGTESAGRSSGKSKGKSLTASAKAALAASKKPPVSKFVALRHSAYKALFGWLDPKFKRNGKKLLTSNSVLSRFMVRFVRLWHAMPALTTLLWLAQNICCGGS